MVSELQMVPPVIMIDRQLDWLQLQLIVRINVEVIAMSLSIKKDGGVVWFTSTYKLDIHDRIVLSIFIFIQ